MAIKKTDIDINKIVKKKEEFKKTIEEIEKTKKKNTTQEFLNIIKDIIEEEYNKGTSYKSIVKAIYKVYSIKISESTLRAYIRNVLKLPPRNKKKESVENNIWQ